MSTTTIYHNPRCTKSRQTLELLQQRGISPSVVEYLKTPPSAAELLDIVQKLGIKAQQLLRTGEEEYRELNLATFAGDDAALAAIMVKHPKLIERPIVLHGAKAAIGRPPENVLAIL
jgi:arsenate reductase